MCSLFAQVCYLPSATLIVCQGLLFVGIVCQDDNSPERETRIVVSCARMGYEADISKDVEIKEL
jgi:hypothetical protein